MCWYIYPHIYMARDHDKLKQCNKSTHPSMNICCWFQFLYAYIHKQTLTYIYIYVCIWTQNLLLLLPFHLFPGLGPCLLNNVIIYGAIWFHSSRSEWDPVTSFFICHLSIRVMHVGTHRFFKGLQKSKICSKKLNNAKYISRRLEKPNEPKKYHTWK